MLLAVLVDTCDPVQRDLDRLQDRREEVAFALEHTGHETTEGNDERSEDDEIDRDLKPAIDAHRKVLLRTAQDAEGRK